ncbi:PAS-domain containing protein [Dongia soli]|uniref:PAS-domain containing protein n=1 Tax=Dongia soli TaxID=600628 RepID=A0ABU5EE11_9PROT|nr:PAS-domain containing protein [Dongia soli]MDY0884594.1 PAS-domain containing protein [Dongia soli]
MHSIGSISLQLLQNVSLFALVVVGYAAIRRRQTLSPVLRDAIIGLVFGGCMVLAMSLPVVLGPGVMIDGRSVLTGTVAVFGGPLGTVVALVMAIGYRVWLGGSGAAAGVIAISIAGLVGLTFRSLLLRGKFKSGPLTFLVLGTLVVSATIAAFFLLRWNAISPIAHELVVPLYLVVPIGTAVLGAMLMREDARLALQRTLSRQTRLFETIFDSMSEGVTVADPDGRIILVNPTAERLAGAPVGSMLNAERISKFGMLETDGQTPFAVEKLPLARAIRGEATDDIELIVDKSGDGAARRLTVSGRPLIDEDGKIQGGVAVFRDITEQNRIEEELRRSEELFALAVSGSRDGIWDYNPVTEAIWFSPRYKEILGYTDADFPNDLQFWKSLMLPEDHAASTKQFFEYQAGFCDSIDIIQRFRHKDGSIVHTHNRALGRRDESGRIIRLVGAITDITPLIRAEERLKSAIGAMESGFALFDAEDRLIICNDGFLTPAAREEYDVRPGCRFEDIFRALASGPLSAVDAAADPEAWLAWRLEMHRNPPQEPLEVQSTDGRWMRVTERRTAEGGYVCIWTDISAVKAAEARLRDAIESIHEGFALFDEDLRLIINNQRFCDLYPRSAPVIRPGVTMAEILRYGAENGEYPDVETPDEIENFVRQWSARFRQRQPFVGEGPFTDGRWVLVSHRSTASGGYVSTRADITVQKQREEALQLQQALLRSITDAIPAMVAFVDAEGRYHYCNKAYADARGTDRETIAGRSLRQVFGENYDEIAANVEEVMQGRTISFERPLIDARHRHVEGRYIPQLGVGGEVEGFYVVLWDITERHAKEQKLIAQANTDRLTGLMNRAQFTELLQEELNRQARYGQNIAVMFLDVDHFKTINDTLGHAAGDAVLKTFAERLRANIRSSDYVARFGGDEFVILLIAPRSEADVRAVAEKLVSAVREPLIFQGQEIALSTSIGIAYASTAVHAPEILLATADTVLYEAKRAGRNTFRLSPVVC